MTPEVLIPHEGQTPQKHVELRELCYSRMPELERYLLENSDFGKMLVAEFSGAVTIDYEDADYQHIIEIERPQRHIVGAAESGSKTVFKQPELSIRHVEQSRHFRSDKSVSEYGYFPGQPFKRGRMSGGPDASDDEVMKLLEMIRDGELVLPSGKEIFVRKKEKSLQ